MRLDDARHVDAVDCDGAVLDVVEAVNQVGDCGLSGTGTTHEGNLLVGHGINVNVEEHLFFGGVAKVHHVEFDAAVDLHKLWLVTASARDAPRPQAGALRHGDEHAVVGLDGVDQRHVALIGLNRLVEDAEHALGTHAGVEHAVDLLAHLRYGASKTLVEREKRHQRTQTQVDICAEDERGPHHTDEHVTQVAQVAIDGHHDVGDAVGVVGAVAQLLVDALKVVDGALLVAECLDHALSGHHLLDEAVDLGQLLLLLLEVAA